jgi:hypothetical protein
MYHQGQPDAAQLHSTWSTHAAPPHASARISASISEVIADVDQAAKWWGWSRATKHSLWNAGAAECAMG